MIDTLLKKDLPQAYGLTRPTVQLNYSKLSGFFDLSDSKTCTDCKTTRTNHSNCDEKVLKVDASNNSITVVEHEAYLNQFAGTQFGKGKKCDYLMCDADTKLKIVFSELGCYSDNYVEAKQKTAHLQLCDSIRRFINQSCGENFVNQFTEKILLFGRRDPAIVTTTSTVAKRGDIKGNMQVFLTNAFSKSKNVESQESIDGITVKFLIVNFPETYIW